MTHFPSVWILCGDRVEGGGLLLAWAVGVRVGRRGRRRDGPVAVLWLWAVPVSPGDSIVGGGSVVQKRLVVHHVCWPRASSSCPSEISVPQLGRTRNNPNKGCKNENKKMKIKIKPESNYSCPVVPKATQRRWLTRSHDKNKGNEETTLRQNETSSLSMRQLCPLRRNNRESPTGRNERSQSVNG